MFVCRIWILNEQVKGDGETGDGHDMMGCLVSSTYSIDEERRTKRKKRVAKFSLAKVASHFNSTSVHFHRKRIAYRLQERAKKRVLWIMYHFIREPWSCSPKTCSLLFSFHFLLSWSSSFQKYQNMEYVYSTFYLFFSCLLF